MGENCKAAMYWLRVTVGLACVPVGRVQYVLWCNVRGWIIKYARNLKTLKKSQKHIFDQYARGENCVAYFYIQGRNEPAATAAMAIYNVWSLFCTCLMQCNSIVGYHVGVECLNKGFMINNKCRPYAARLLLWKREKNPKSKVSFGQLHELEVVSERQGW